MCHHGLDQGGPVTDGGDHLVAVLGQEPDDAFPEEDRVVGDYYAHGTGVYHLIDPHSSAAGPCRLV
ncbi:hypothetical protein GCM10027280_38880 [Micromonospora polyrhachis]